jgi:hypothetical protein
MGDYHTRRYEVRLTDEEETVLKDDLANLLDTFERDEIPPERRADVKLNDPILMLLAQHRSFRICRNHFLPYSIFPTLQTHIVSCQIGDSYPNISWSIEKRDGGYGSIFHYEAITETDSSYHHDAMRSSREKSKQYFLTVTVQIAALSLGKSIK